MLSSYPPTPTLPVKDLAAARTFYEDVLGFSAGEENDGGVTYPSGPGAVFVYPSAYAGTNKATAAFFTVPAEAFDDEVARLREKGVELQTFDLPSGSWDDGVLSDGPMRAVWFADPDGNILNVVTTT